MYKNKKSGIIGIVVTVIIFNIASNTFKYKNRKFDSRRKYF